MVHVTLACVHDSCCSSKSLYFQLSPVTRTTEASTEPRRASRNVVQERTSAFYGLSRHSCPAVTAAVHPRVNIQVSRPSNRPVEMTNALRPHEPSNKQRRSAWLDN